VVHIKIFLTDLYVRTRTDGCFGLVYILPQTRAFAVLMMVKKLSVFTYKSTINKKFAQTGPRNIP